MLLFSVKSADCQIEKLSAAGFEPANCSKLLFRLSKIIDFYAFAPSPLVFRNGTTPPITASLHSATRSKLYLLRHPMYMRMTKLKITSISPPAFCI